jgi:serine protease Do
MYSPTGGYVGLSFAIPSDVAMQVIEQLKHNGHVTRGWLGVVIQEVDKKLADSFGLDRPKGALVVQISPGGPAALAGIKEGDIITSFDGGEIATSADLPHMVGQLSQGKTSQVAIIRDGKEQTLPITVGVLPDPNNSAPKLTEQKATKGGRLGVKVAEVDEQMKKKWNLSGGVVVMTVDQNGPGANAGLRPGDVIAQLGYQQIENVETFNRTVAELPARRLMPIRVVRNGVASFETIMIDE